MILRNAANGTVLHLHPAVRWPLAAGLRRWDGERDGGAWLWSLEDRWWLEVRLAFQEYGPGFAPQVRLDGYAVPPLLSESAVVEVAPGSVIETGDAEWFLEWEPDDPRAPAGRGGTPQGEPPHAGPDEAREAFTRGDARYADAMIVLARNSPDDVRIREAFLRASRNGDPAMAGAAVRGLAFLASRGVVERDAARKAVERVKDDAPLDLRMFAAQALCGYDPLAAAPRLLALVREAFVEGELVPATVECARLLCGPEGDPAIREELLRDAQAVAADASARKRRVSAVRVLAVLAAAGEPAALRVLRSMVADGHESVRLAVLRACVPLGADAIDVLVEGCADENERIRTEAFAALRKHESAAARLLAAVDASAPGPRRDLLFSALERLTG